MEDWINWLADNWKTIVIPVSVFVTTLIILLWLRRFLLRTSQRWLSNATIPFFRVQYQNIVWASFIWSFILSSIPAIAVSNLPASWEAPILKILWTFFVISIGIPLISTVGVLIAHYTARAKIPANTETLISNTIRAIIFIVLGLIILQLWGIPTTPIFIIVIFCLLAALFLLREIIPNLIAGFQLDVKQGEYIKTDTGEEGYVSAVTWKNIKLSKADGTIIILPTSRLFQVAITKYGQPLKKARDPFRFYSRSHLSQLTSLEAKNLRQLIDILKTAPEAVVYYHTHRFLEEHHFLTPEPSNDFAIWVTNALGNEDLGERLAAVDTFTLPNLMAVRDRLVGVMEEYLESHPYQREANDGSEFYFMKSVTAIYPTPYVAHDLREFTEILRKISLGSLYFHVFEARLRLGKGLNDFTIWLRDSLDEKELGDAIAQIDPYNYTLEGLRQSLTQLVESHIQ